MGLTALCALLPFTQPARAMSGTTQVAWTGKPVAAVAEWPAGVLELVNDPLRGDGWNPWFSELPNDVNWYEFKIHNTDEVNQLIGKLAAIKATNVVVRLNAGTHAAKFEPAQAASAGGKTAVVFSIGSQQQLNDWYQRLPETEPGVRKFGVQIYKQAPVASPPTLTVYAGCDAIDLEKLKVPASVQVVSDSRPGDPASPQITKAIEDYLAKRQARLEHAN